MNRSKVSETCRVAIALFLWDRRDLWLWSFSIYLLEMCAILTIGDSSVISLFVVTVICKGVRDASTCGLVHLVFDRIVETLYTHQN